MALIGNPLMPLHPMQDPLALIHAALAARRVDPGAPGLPHPLPVPLPFGQGHGNLDDYIPDGFNPGGPMQDAVPIHPAITALLHAHLTQSGYGPGEAMHHLGGHEAQAAQIWEQHHPGAMKTGKNIPGWVGEELVPEMSRGSQQSRRPPRSRRASMASAALRAS